MNTQRIKQKPWKFGQVVFCENSGSLSKAMAAMVADAIIINMMRA